MVRLYRIGEISHNQKMEEQKAGNEKEKAVVDNVEQLKSIVTTNEINNNNDDGDIELENEMDTTANNSNNNGSHADTTTTTSSNNNNNNNNTEDDDDDDSDDGDTSDGTFDLDAVLSGKVELSYMYIATIIGLYNNMCTAACG